MRSTIFASTLTLASAVFVACSLCGCVAVWGNSHNIVQKDSNSISIEFDPAVASSEKVAGIALEHCRMSGRVAVLRNDSRRYLAGGIHFHSYQCESASRSEETGLELVRASVAQLRAGDWVGAAILATRAIATGNLSINQTAAAHTMRSYANFKMGKIPEAWADINRAIQLKPDFTAAIKFRETVASQRSPRPGREIRPLPPSPKGPEPPIIEF